MISALPHLFRTFPPQVRKAPLKPLRRTPAYRGAGVRCGAVVSATDDPKTAPDFPHLKGAVHMTPMEAEARRKYDRSHITDEERRAIDAAVQAGRIQRIPRGVSAMAHEYVWTGNELKSTTPDAGRWAFQQKGSYQRRQQAEKEQRLKQTRAMHEAGHTQEQIRRALGCGKRNIENYYRELGIKTTRAEAAALGARVKTARKMWAAGYRPDMTRKDRAALIDAIAAKVERSTDTVRAYITDAQMGEPK